MEAYRYSARFYDALLSPFIRAIRVRVLRLIKKHRYSAILDVCCGTGEQLKLLRQHGFDGKGIDISDAMLNVARKGEYPADCTHQDATHMQYEDAKFDLVMTSFALHEKDHATAYRIVQEMLMNTSEGKDILIVDYELSEKTSSFSKMLIYFIEWLAGGEHFRNFRSYIEKGGLPALLTGSGLKEIERHYFAQNGVVLLLLRKEKK